jgi:hypothetical protein
MQNPDSFTRAPSMLAAGRFIIVFPDFRLRAKEVAAGIQESKRPYAFVLDAHPRINAYGRAIRSPMVKTISLSPLPLPADAFTMMAG